MNTKTLKRFESLINGPHFAIFCKIMDILTSGYGKLDVDNDVLFGKFFLEEKIKFQLILFNFIFFIMVSSVDIISTFDIKLVHETFNNIRSQYPDKSVRFQFF